jgi:hypothetical protein
VAACAARLMAATTARVQRWEGQIDKLRKQVGDLLVEAFPSWDLVKRSLAIAQHEAEPIQLSRSKQAQDSRGGFGRSIYRTSGGLGSNGRVLPPSVSASTCPVMRFGR